MFEKLIKLWLKGIFLGDFSIVKIFLVKLLCYHDNYFKYVMFWKYNGFASKARVSAFMYFLVVLIISDVFNLTIYSYSKFKGGTHAGNGDFFGSRNACVIFKPIGEKQIVCCYGNNDVA
jgi:hypothetical protein